MPVLVTCKFDKDQIDNECAGIETSFSPLWSMKFFQCSRAHNTNFGLVWFLFYGASTHFRSFRAWSVNLPHCSWASLLGSLPVLSAHSFASNWQLLFLNQRKRENERRNLFMTKSPRKNVPDMGIELGAHAKRTGFRSSYRARYWSKWFNPAGIWTHLRFYACLEHMQVWQRSDQKWRRKNWRHFSHYMFNGRFWLPWQPQFWSNLPQNLMQPFPYSIDTTHKIWQETGQLVLEIFMFKC